MTPTANAAAAAAPLTPGSPVVMQLILSLTPGGTERLVVEIVTRLLGEFRMVVCCLDDAGEWAAELTAHGVPVVALQRQPGFHPMLGVRIARLAKQYGASVVHCHHYSPFVYGQIAAIVSRRLRMVFTEHGRLSDDPPTLKRRTANAVLGRLSGSMFAVSSALRQHMIDAGFPARRVGVIHNGIDPGPRPTAAARTAARARLGIAPGTFLLGTAARLDPVKDLQTLIGGLIRLRDRVPSAQLAIVGSGEERAALEASARASGCEEAIHFLGYRPDVRDLLAAFDVYVNCSVSEGISLTILEAMAAALPVVATSVGGTPEIVIEGTTGFLVEPRAPGRLADAAAALATAPERRAALGAAGRARVEAAFAIDRMVGEYAREYRRAGAR